jgi:imidazolonepropionase
MLQLGTTTVEIKSGYGLDTATELKLLAAVETLAARSPLDIVPTFLGAHATPPEYAGQPDAYIDLICAEMLPAVRAWWEAARFAASGVPLFNDVFCEAGVFDVAQTERVLAQDNGWVYAPSCTPTNLWRWAASRWRWRCAPSPSTTWT